MAGHMAGHLNSADGSSFSRQYTLFRPSLSEFSPFPPISAGVSCIGKPLQTTRAMADADVEGGSASFKWVLFISLGANCR